MGKSKKTQVTVTETEAPAKIPPHIKSAGVQKTSGNQARASLQHSKNFIDDLFTKAKNISSKAQRNAEKTSDGEAPAASQSKPLKARRPRAADHALLVLKYSSNRYYNFEWAGLQCTWKACERVLVSFQSGQGKKDDLFGLVEEARKKTEEGWNIYSEVELKLDKKGGDTPLCPFDCTCCY